MRPRVLIQYLILSTQEELVKHLAEGMSAGKTLGDSRAVLFMRVSGRKPTEQNGQGIVLRKYRLPFAGKVLH